MEPIILASGSLRRQEYFRLLGLPFSVMPPQADERYESGGDPRAAAEAMAARKVSRIVELLEGRTPPWIAGGDTIITLDKEILGKPADRDDARRMIGLLQGRDHEVISAMALFNGKKRTMDCRSVSSVVSFAPLTDAEIEWYLGTGEWQGVAGGYRIQGLGACLVSAIRGSYSAIVGLPMREFYVMLRENGYPYGV